jgi:AAA domain
MPAPANARGRGRARGARVRSSGRSDREAPKAIGSGRPKVTVKREKLSAFNESVNICLYGDSGVGKTVLAGGVPNAVFLSTEKGVVSAQRTGSKADLWRAPTWDHVEAALDAADKELGPDDWLLLDSGTKMQVLVIRWILVIIHEDNEARDLDIPAIQDHQKWQNMFTRMIDRVVEARYNSIITATAMHKTDQEGDALILPTFTGKDYAIANYICSQMDCVFYYGVVPQENAKAPTTRRILTETYPPYFAKDRFNILDRWIDVYDGEYDVMAEIIDTINEEAPPAARKAAKAGKGAAA